MVIGAGGIVRDAHLPAYQKAGISVFGIMDLDQIRAKSLSKDWKIPTVYKNLAEAVEDCGTRVIYDIATPPNVIGDILPTYS